ncbi:MAG TPA: tetratricopeptide repeat protein [Chitinophagaceae bacterium]|jgi:tetratricopeptide (TPR) repeat protein
MTRVVFILVAAFITPSCLAQQQELDSLTAVLKQYSKEDTTRLNLLNSLAFDCSGINPDRGLALSDEAIALAKKLNDQGKLAAAYNYKAMNFAGKGEDSIALLYYRQALHIHEQRGDRLHIGTTNNNIAIELVNLSDYPAALEYHAKAYAIFESLNNKLRMGNSLNNTGVIYLYIADYPKALEYYLRALRLFEQIGKQQLAASTYSNIGLVYDHLKNFPLSLQYQRKAYALYEQTGNRQSMANALANIGNVYQDTDSSHKALEYYQKALAISESIGDKRGIASAYGNMGIAYNRLPDFPNALKYLQQALDLNTQLGDKQRTTEALNEISTLYLNASDAFLRQQGIPLSARYDKAAGYANRSLSMAEAIGSPDIQRDAWESLYHIYEKQKDFALALPAYKRYVVMRDSVMNAKTKQEVTRKEMQFEFEKTAAIEKADREKEQAVSAEALNRQRIVKNAALTGALLLLASAAIIFVFYKRRRDAEEQKTAAEFQAKVSGTEMKALRSQMNPHFIFNSLNSINDYIDRHDTANATLYTTRFARLMRMILENSEQKEISLAEDLKALELYMQLEALRLNHRFSYEITTDGSLDPESTLVPPLLLQPFVENSIWHGVAKKQGGGKIQVRIKKEGSMINCIVEDNGIGRVQSAREDNQPPGERKSLGMKITMARIEIINQFRQSKATVALYDLDQGTRVELRLPLESRF